MTNNNWCEVGGVSFTQNNMQLETGMPRRNRNDIWYHNNKMNTCPTICSSYHNHNIIINILDSPHSLHAIRINKPLHIASHRIASHPITANKHRIIIIILLTSTATGLLYQHQHDLTRHDILLRCDDTWYMIQPITNIIK